MTACGPKPATATWKHHLAPYARPRLARSLLDVATSVVPYVALSALMLVLLGHVPYWAILLLAVPAGGFLLRTYIVFHDCTHGSFLPSKRANAWLGMTLGLLVYSTFYSWRHSHAIHHATSGDLDRRGTGDVPMMTVAEYHAAPWHVRTGYRLFRNPLVMFGLGWIWALVIQPRLFSRSDRPRIRNSVIATNVVIALLVAGLVKLVGWQAYLLVQVPSAMLAGASGVFLFYVQHQFEDAYWENHGEWSYAEAALQGSSYLRLPAVLRFFTGNIGFHHVHHLNARIPNYNLPRAHADHASLQQVPTLSLWDGLRSVRLKLYDEHAGRLVTFAAAKRALAAPRRVAPAPGT